MRYKDLDENQKEALAYLGYILLTRNGSLEHLYYINGVDALVSKVLKANIDRETLIDILENVQTRRIKEALL